LCGAVQPFAAPRSAILGRVKRNPLVRLFGAFVEWLDVVVLVLLLAWGVAVAVVVIAGGGTGIQVGLVVLLVAVIALRWVRTSFAWEKLRECR
jgi:hypothetical protein